jgi:hypothetical protein
MTSPCASCGRGRGAPGRRRGSGGLAVGRCRTRHECTVPAWSTRTRPPSDAAPRLRRRRGGRPSGRGPAWATCPPPRGRLIVVGAGKAAAVMAAEVERAYPAGPRPPAGVVVTRHGQGPERRIAVLEAAHPVPDEAGAAATEAHAGARRRRRSRRPRAGARLGRRLRAAGGARRAVAGGPAGGRRGAAAQRGRRARDERGAPAPGARRRRAPGVARAAGAGDRAGGLRRGGRRPGRHRQRADGPDPGDDAAALGSSTATDRRARGARPAGRRRRGPGAAGERPGWARVTTRSWPRRAAAIDAAAAALRAPAGRRSCWPTTSPARHGRRGPSTRPSRAACWPAAAWPRRPAPS